MPKLNVELDDKNDFVGGVPPELDAIHKRIETTAYANGLKKAREDSLAEAEAKAQELVAKEQAKWAKELERAKVLEEENVRLRDTEASLSKRYGDTARQREELHAKEVADRAEQIVKRDAQLQKSLKATIRAAAATNGARDESLTELESLLVNRIARDAELEPVVLDEDGKPYTSAGKPVSVEAFVKQYLDNHPHHRKPATARGGGATGGATYQGHSGAVGTFEEAKARYENGDRSPAAIDAMLRAKRQKAS